MKILTPQEYIIRNVTLFPSLYAAPTYHDVKLKIFDQVFNTIGNGIKRKSFIGNYLTKQELKDAQKWFNCEKAAYGYVKQPNDNNPHSIGNVEIIVPVNEIRLHPEIKRWLEFKTGKHDNFFPNFKKEYSLVWESDDLDFSELGKEWASAAEWFYLECKKYFLDKNRVKNYQHIFPMEDDRDSTIIVESYLRFFEDYTNNEDISKAFECEFIGDKHNTDDIYRFCVLKWNNEHERILNFIDETLVHLS